MLKRYSSSVELLPHDVVELILERLPVKSLVRLRSVSKTWKLTIQTRRFQERQLIQYRSQSRDPDILLVHYGDHGPDTDARRLVCGSSVVYTVCFPTLCNSVCPCICDGLVCFYNNYVPSVSVVVVNPATMWHQSLPLARIQQLLVDRITKRLFVSPYHKLGFAFGGTFTLLLLVE
ncbi:hypothetical protein F2Q70_00034765 [Brassica cretica]|uniref:F-box domain-containing protein n=1 Tax=Brassica cretica TaxID=69181 RepID=A0A8S9JNZ4_BRACR|nr:hypothetical protein F2Q70_00034765 [Brassica cretica]